MIFNTTYNTYMIAVEHFGRRVLVCPLPRSLDPTSLSSDGGEEEEEEEEEEEKGGQGEEEGEKDEGKG